MLTIHLSGSWRPGNVAAFIVPCTRRDTPASRASIDAQWRRSAAGSGLHLFDGPMCRLESYRVEGLPPRGLVLELSHTSYREFYGTNLYGPRDLPPQALANPLGVSPALETGDGYLLFGQRNGRVAYYPHRLHPFSGSLQPPPAGESLDVFAECRRELAEELNLAAGDVAEMVLLGIVEDERIQHPELIMHARTPLRRKEVESRLERTEHAGLHAVAATAPAIARSLADERFTPVARAALRLFADGPGRTS